MDLNGYYILKPDDLIEDGDMWVYHNTLRKCTNSCGFILQHYRIAIRSDSFTVVRKINTTARGNRKIQYATTI